jgi:TPR repeat protein
MRAYSKEEIKLCFATSTDFNEIFDVFQAALQQNITDIEPYRLLFYNHSLSADEVRLFGEKLSNHFPQIAFEVFMWLASVFEATHSTNDNYELALYYYMKAAEARPVEPDPYLDACDCYEPDLNIPPLTTLIDFVKAGVKRVPDPKSLLRCLARLYELSGDPEQGAYYRRKAEDQGSAPNDQ